jgi:hypothetical protein
MGSLPYVNGVSGGWSNPFDSACFGYITGQVEFSATQQMAFMIQNDPVLAAQLIVAAQAATRNSEAEPNGEIVGARIVDQPGTEVEVDRPYNTPTPLDFVLGAVAVDIGFPEPTDVAIPKWVGWGLGIGGAAIVTAVAPDILRPLYERTRRGERRRAAKPDGTPNPWKHTRPHPTDPDKIIYRDPHTGKDVVKPKPRGYDR